MKFVSTRGTSPAIAFEDVILSGPAPDGGLYMPEVWPKLDLSRIRSKPNITYADLVWSILSTYAGDPSWNAALERIATQAYTKFNVPAVAPLREIAKQRWLLELFHGPTLSFKDFALQVLGPLMNEALERRNKRALVVAATSGDTGAAAVSALANLSHIDLVVLHPKGRISDIQRRQMTTSTAANVRNIAIEGTFDDCQSLVKQLFADKAFAEKHNLAAINSINWIRIAVQTAYYLSSCLALGKPLTFSVPTGNFGDAFAGFAALQMGVPVKTLMIATNSNDIVARAIATGVYQRGPVHATLSPAMDIQVASNFERLIYESHNRNAAFVVKMMDLFASKGSVQLAPGAIHVIQKLFGTDKIKEEETLSTISMILKTTGQLVDPHTAVALTATRRLPETDDVVVLATAHPAKFPETIKRATGQTIELPEHLRPILTLPERYDTLPIDLATLKAEIEAGPRTASARTTIH